MVGDQNKDGKSHVGLMNVKTRLYYLLSAEMNIESNSDGTKVEIIINNPK